MEMRDLFWRVSNAEGICCVDLLGAGDRLLCSSFKVVTKESSRWWLVPQSTGLGPAEWVFPTGPACPQYRSKQGNPTASCPRPRCSSLDLAGLPEPATAKWANYGRRICSEQDGSSISKWRSNQVGERNLPSTPTAKRFLQGDLCLETMVRWGVPLRASCPLG